MGQESFTDSIFAFLRDNPLLVVGLLLAVGIAVLRRFGPAPLMDGRARRDSDVQPGPDTPTPRDEADASQKETSGVEDARSESPEQPIETRGREASDPAADDRPHSHHGTPIGGDIDVPVVYVPKDKIGELEKDILVFNDSDLIEIVQPGAPDAKPSPSEPLQPRGGETLADRIRRRAEEVRAAAESADDSLKENTPASTPGVQIFGLERPAKQDAEKMAKEARAEQDEALPEAEENVAPPQPEPETAPEPQPAPDALQFSAHYPREVRPRGENPPDSETWHPLLAYLFKESAADAVSADAKERLGPRPDVRVTRRPALGAVPSGALVIATPDVPGLEFNPPSASIRFRKDWHRFEFEFQAVSAPLDEAANGAITFQVEGVIVGEVPVSIYISQSAAGAEMQQVEGKAYQAVFCSYSHKDLAIARLVEAAVLTLGYTYLRDMTTLRAGEDWNEALMAMIDRADIFQLFWSENSAGSKYVEEEWRYALSLIEARRKDRRFIRPVRWVDPPRPNPPSDLGWINFYFQPDLAEFGALLAGPDSSGPDKPGDTDAPGKA